MGLLLREVLKTLCGVNQWCYAIFWKIGCQNAKLLIWEECYHEPNSSAVLRTGNLLQVLVNKMMMNNQVYLVGQGIVGRAAFTGNHEWILAKTYTGSSHPPEVIGEICDQFSGGMQTVAVIPTPHGVVQLGSSLTIMENIGFVNNVKSLILQLGCVPGALFSDNLEKDSTERIGVPVSFETPDSMMVQSSHLAANSISQPSVASLTPTISKPSGSQVRQIQNTQQSIVSSSCPLDGTLYEQKLMSNVTPGNSFNSLLKNGVFEEGSLPSKPDPWLKKQTSSFNSSPFSHQSVIGRSGVNNSVPPLLEQPVLTVTEPQILVNDKNGAIAKEEMRNDFLFRSIDYEDPHGQPLSGDDLYDVLGADFKNRLLNSRLDSLLVDGPNANSQVDKDTSTFSNVEETTSGLFDCSFFTDNGNNDLLDAVVSRAHSASKQSLDDNLSCKTTVAKVSSFSAPSMSDNVRKDILSCSEKSGIKASSSIRSGSCSQITSIHGSQLSSWVANNMKPDSSVSTAYSKKNEETRKPTRKRLKPGENPRPRPKDRQMIQDRLKELRELVPNGAKCSIDALLERTIKHMLFLQSVSKHADKLKEAGDSKIISKEGGPLSKDPFEGGATWGFEVGSKSMVCPIIVEDLSPPRQMRIEILCEERGLFLEIADLVRGLGLTILKGVMEARNDKIWAHFTVEANRDVTRMEVFMSLVHLLEQTVKGGMPLENNMMGYHGISQAASIPATGSLQ